MWTYSITQWEEGYVVLADGEPQLLFETASQAAALIGQVDALAELPTFRLPVEDVEST